MKRFLVIISLLLCVISSYGQDRFHNFLELEEYLNTLRFDGTEDKVKVINLRNAVFRKIQTFLNSKGITVDYCSEFGFGAGLDFYRDGHKFASAELRFDTDVQGFVPGEWASHVKTIKLICYPRGYSSISKSTLLFPEYYPINYYMYVYETGKWLKKYSDFLYKTQKQRIISELYPLSGYPKRIITLTEEGKYSIEEYDVNGKLIIKDAGRYYGYDSEPTEKIISALKIVGDNDSKRLTPQENNDSKRLTPQENNDVFVDLGLPSGTLWKRTAESGLYDYDTALKLFGNRLPSYEQFVELKDNCTWTWNGKGYTVSGRNGRSIYLEAAGWRDEKGRITLVGTDGGYWTNRSKGSEDAWYLNFTTSKVRMLSYHRNSGLSVLLIK